MIVVNVLYVKIWGCFMYAKWQFPDLERDCMHKLLTFILFLFCNSLKKKIKWNVSFFSATEDGQPVVTETVE